MDPNRNFEDGVNGGEHADDVAAFEYAAPTPAWLVLLKSAPELPASDIDAATPPCMFPALTTGYDIWPTNPFIFPTTAFLYDGVTGGLTCVLPLLCTLTESILTLAPPQWQNGPETSPTAC
jgi:hypothetical protein